MLPLLPLKLPGPIGDLITEYITDTNKAGEFYSKFFEMDTSPDTNKTKLETIWYRLAEYRQSRNALAATPSTNEEDSLNEGDSFCGLEHYLDAWEGGLKDIVCLNEYNHRKYLFFKKKFQLFIDRFKECHEADTIFPEAIQIGSLRLIRHLVGKRINHVSDWDNNPYNVPIYACIRAPSTNLGREEIFNWLLDKKCNINGKDEEGETPLHLAINKLEIDDLKFVEKLIDANADIDATTNKGMSVLFAAFNKVVKIKFPEDKLGKLLKIFWQANAKLTSKEANAISRFSELNYIILKLYQQYTEIKPS